MINFHDSYVAELGFELVIQLLYKARHKGHIIAWRIMSLQN